MAAFMINDIDLNIIDDFPQQAPAVAQYQFLLRYIAYAAVQAIGFSWLPTVTPEGIIFTSISAADGHDVVGQSQLALIAIGAALAALHLAARRFGRTAEIAILPDHAGPDIIACVTLRDFRDPSLDDRLRFNALTAPAARSLIDETRPLPQGLQRALPHLITRPGVWVSAVAAASDRMRVRDCLRAATLTGETADRFGAASVMRNELIGPRDLASPGVFLLGTQDGTPASVVALGETLQELVVLLRMQEVHVRVARLSHALGERTVDALALPKVPQFMVEAAYRAPRRDR